MATALLEAFLRHGTLRAERHANSPHGTATIAVKKHITDATPADRMKTFLLTDPKGEYTLDEDQLETLLRVFQQKYGGALASGFGLPVRYNIRARGATTQRNATFIT